MVARAIKGAGILHVLHTALGQNLQTHRQLLGVGEGGVVEGGHAELVAHLLLHLYLTHRHVLAVRHVHGGRAHTHGSDHTRLVHGSDALVQGLEAQSRRGVNRRAVAVVQDLQLLGGVGILEQPDIVAVEDHVGGGINGSIDLKLRKSQILALAVRALTQFTGQELHKARLHAAQLHGETVPHGLGRGTADRSGGGVIHAVGGNQDVKGLGKTALVPRQRIELDMIHLAGGSQINVKIVFGSGIGIDLPRGGESRGAVTVVDVEIAVPLIVLGGRTQRKALTGHVGHGQLHRLKGQRIEGSLGSLLLSGLLVRGVGGGLGGRVGIHGQSGVGGIPAARTGHGQKTNQ